MKCIVCGASLEYFFEKDFEGKWSLDVVEYWRCPRCGLVVAKTLYDMSKQEWETLNNTWHKSFFEIAPSDAQGADPRARIRCGDAVGHREQAEVIVYLSEQGLITKKRHWIDYGCGDGALADSLIERQLPTRKCDPYMQGEGYVAAKDLRPIYGLVISTAVFEHVRERASLNEIARLVAGDGVLALHTRVLGHIRKNPTWSYLLPVHCTFFTNDAMQRLFDEWGFVASLYHIPSLTWFWFRKAANVDRWFRRKAPNTFLMDKAFVVYRR